MQYSKFFIPIVTIMIFSSCSKDLSEEIVGNWILESADIPACEEFGDSAIALMGQNGCIDYFGEELCFSLTINEDGSGTAIGYDGDTEPYDLTYTVDDSNNKVSICIDGECVGGTYADDTLTYETQEDGCPVFFFFKKK